MNKEVSIVLAYDGIRIYHCVTVLTLIYNIIVDFLSTCIIAMHSYYTTLITVNNKPSIRYTSEEVFSLSLEGVK